MADSMNENDLAQFGAESIRKAYEAYRGRFDEITARAGRRFKQQDWQGARVDREERLDLYRRSIDEIEADLRRLLQNRSDSKSVWARIKAVYTDLIGPYPDCELAETFFSSITRRMFHTIGVDPQIEFVSSQFAGIPVQGQPTVYKDYGVFTTPVDMVQTILGDLPLAGGIVNLTAEAGLAAAEINKALAAADGSMKRLRVQIVKNVFYRGKGAFVIGRLKSASFCMPLVFALTCTPEGIIVDSVLTDEDDISVLFSFTRAYFHVTMDSPCELVGFLKTILPNKRIAELYTAIGFHKHGKTELYRELLERLAVCGEERFDTSPGKRGMVMVVFNMPGDDLVFKLIRDRFGASKQTTRQEVMDKYALVFKHDRAGRLVDAHAFEHLKLESCCFSNPLLEELKQHAAGNARVEEDHVIIAHTYIQRRVIPLDVFLQQADEDAARRAIVDFGNAIKDLAATNIFPGDILLKNFGVTRHGRVVFYDYDEICPLTQCHFRALPQAHAYEDELAARPWFFVGANDVFPEEFHHFLALPDHLLKEFKRYHSDLFGVEFWQNTQQAINNGNLADIVPYASIRRLKHRDAHN